MYTIVHYYTLLYTIILLYWSVPKTKFVFVQHKHLILCLCVRSFPKLRTSFLHKRMRDWIIPPANPIHKNNTTMA